MPGKTTLCIAVLAMAAVAIGSGATTASASVPQVQLVSTTSSGSAAAGNSSELSTSRDGRFQVFTSSATNLVPDDTNKALDVFVRDRETGHVERVSVDSRGGQAAGPSFDGSISDDGRFVEFTSWAALDPADHNQEYGPSRDSSDIYLHDRKTGETRLVSGAQEFAAAGIISGNGRYVVYYSDEAFRWDRQTGRAQSIDFPSYYAYDESPTGVSADGNVVSLLDCDPCDNGHYATGLVADVQRRHTEPIDAPIARTHPTDSVIPGGVSPDGRYVAVQVSRNDFLFYGTDLFLLDRRTGQFRHIVSVSMKHHIETAVAVGPDGQRVAFATNESLVPSDKDHVRDIYEWTSSGGLRRVSAPAVPGVRAESIDPSYSADGKWITFTSRASDLVSGDNNKHDDVFIAPTR